MRLRITIGPSRMLAGVLAVAHGFALAVVCVAAFPVRIAFALAAAITLSCALSIWRSALLRVASAIIEMEVEEGGAVACRLRSGKRYTARLEDSTFVTPGLTVLNLRSEGDRFARHVTLLPDNVDPESYRRLRILLRWSRPAATSDARADHANNRG